MLKQELQQKQALSPQQILEATLLQLNNSSLEEYILEEFEKNRNLEPSEIVRDENESNLKEDAEVRCKSLFGVTDVRQLTRLWS